MTGTELTREKMRAAVRYLDDAAQRSLTYGDLQHRLVQRLFERAAAEQGYNQRRETDPMNITIHLREITNGVLVSTSSAMLGNEGEQFFASWEIAMSELPGVAAAARERLVTEEATKDYYRQQAVRSTLAVAEEQPEPDFSYRLPEEAAALGEAGPVTYDDEASEPVRAISVEPVEDDGDTTVYSSPSFVIGGTPDFDRQV